MAVGRRAGATRLAPNGKLYIQLRGKIQLVIFLIVIPIGYVGHNLAGQVIRNEQGIRVGQQAGQLIQLFIDFTYQLRGRMPTFSFFADCFLQRVKRFLAQFTHDSSHFHFDQFLSVPFGNIYIIAQKHAPVKQNS